MSKGQEYCGYEFDANESHNGSRSGSSIASNRSPLSILNASPKYPLVQLQIPQLALVAGQVEVDQCDLGVILDSL